MVYNNIKTPKGDPLMLNDIITIMAIIIFLSVFFLGLSIPLHLLEKRIKRQKNKRYPPLFF